MCLFRCDLYIFARNRICHITRNVSCGNAECTVQEYCRRRVVTANAFLIAVKESNRNVFFFIQVAVILLTVFSRMLNIGCDLFDHIGIGNIKSFLCNDAFHIGFRFTVYRKIILVYLFGIYFFICSISAEISRKRGENRVCGGYIIRNGIRIRQRSIGNIILRFRIISASHCKIVRKNVRQHISE